MTKPLALASLVIVTAVWGGTFVVVKDVTQQAPPMDFLAVRFLVAAGALALWSPGRLLVLNRKQWGHGVLMGLLLGIAYIGQTFGQQYTSASMSGFITGMSVVFTPMIAGLLLRHRIGLATWGAVGIATVGLGILSLRGFTVGLTLMHRRVHPDQRGAVSTRPRRAGHRVGRSGLVLPGHHGTASVRVVRFGMNRLVTRPTDTPRRGRFGSFRAGKIQGLHPPTAAEPQRSSSILIKALDRNPGANANFRLDVPQPPNRHSGPRRFPRRRPPAPDHRCAAASWRCRSPPRRESPAPGPR